MEVLNSFFAPVVGILNSFLPRGGEFADQKNCLGVLPREIDGQAWNLVIHNFSDMFAGTLKISRVFRRYQFHP